MSNCSFGTGTRTSNGQPLNGIVLAASALATGYTGSSLVLDSNVQIGYSPLAFVLDATFDAVAPSTRTLFESLYLYNNTINATSLVVLRNVQSMNVA